MVDGDRECRGVNPLLKAVVLKIVGVGSGVLFIHLVALDLATPVQIGTHVMMLPLVAMLLALGEGADIGSAADTSSDGGELAELKRRYADGEIPLYEFESKAERHFEREILDETPDSENADE